MLGSNIMIIYPLPPLPGVWEGDNVGVKYKLLGD